MKQGRALVDLAMEIQRQANAKADFVADTRKLEFVPNGHGPRLAIEGHGIYDVTGHAHRQVGERIGIPAKYYDRMLADAPELLLANVNHWFAHKPEQRMVRTLEGPERDCPFASHSAQRALVARYLVRETNGRENRGDPRPGR